MTSLMQIPSDVKVASAPKDSWLKMVGPTFVLANSALLIVHGTHVTSLAALLPLLGFILCSRWKMKGLLASLFFVAFSIYSQSSRDWWILSYYASLTLSWFICAHPDEQPKLVEDVVVERHDALRDLEKEQWEAKIASLENQLAIAQKHQIETEFQLEKQLQESEQLMAEIASLQTQPLSDEALKLESAPVSEEEADLRQLQVIYRNLREQFDEKSAALRQTRKELFNTETELLALRREIEEFKCEPDGSDFSHIFADQEQLEDENSQLQEIISKLLAPKKVTRRRTKKAIAESESRDLLQ